MMPEFDFINTEANCVVAEFSLREEWKAQNRFKKCGCGNCKKEYIDTQDRLNWALSQGRWKAVYKIPVKTK